MLLPADILQIEGVEGFRIAGSSYGKSRRFALATVFWSDSFEGFLRKPKRETVLLEKTF
jgi:hypothetical protein